MQKDFMEAVYFSEHYLPFRCASDFAELYQQIENKPVYCQGYAILPDSITLLSEYKKYKTPLLTNQKLYIARHSYSDYSSENLEKFQFLLVKKFILWPEKYLLMLIDHFKNRLSEGRYLTNHNSIKIQLGEILSHLSLVSEAIKLTNHFSMVATEVKTIILKLHKLAGGRSFLKENIVEMLCVFEIVRKIYFKKI